MHLLLRDAQVLLHMAAMVKGSPGHDTDRDWCSYYSNHLTAAQALCEDCTDDTPAELWMRAKAYHAEEVTFLEYVTP